MSDTIRAVEPPTSAPRPAQGVASGYRSAVLGLLLLAYTFNFIDRTIIATIGQAIKVDLKISDAQLGLLGGLFFALLYTFLGIPIARLAERYSRTWIITISLVIWSGFTAICGAATSFGQLALYRFGVGIGEAGCSPPAHSLISDFYDPKSRTTALSIYSFGIPLGTMFGAVIGGYLAQHYSWRIAFIVVGLPGLILAAVFRLVVKEPVRGGADVVQHPALAEDVTLSAPAPERRPFLKDALYEVRELASVTKSLLGSWPILNMVLGVTIASFGSYGSGQFVPPYFIRTFGLGLATVGLIVGVVQGFSAGIGTLLGGFLTDFLGKRSKAWYALIPALGLMIATPIYIIAFLQKDWRWLGAILLLPGIFHYTYLGPTFGMVQNAVDVRRRATATALLFFFLNLIALGGGPVFTGWLIDHLAKFNYAHPEVTSWWSSITGAFGHAAGGASFNVECPGGSAPKGSAAAAVAHCRGALSHSTQQGIVVTVCFYAWASLHYFLAAASLAKRDRRAAV